MKFRCVLLLLATSISCSKGDNSVAGTLEDTSVKAIETGLNGVGMIVPVDGTGPPIPGRTLSNDDILELSEFCSNASNCNNERCAGSTFTCTGQCDYTSPSFTCNVKCKEDQCGKYECSSCQFCNKKAAICPLATFNDITHSMFSQDPSFWYQPGHSGMPYGHETSPLFVDLNGDGYLDYFNGMHIHFMVNEDDTLDGRMEMALTLPTDNGTLTFESIGYRIICEDDMAEFPSSPNPIIDLHGQNILDLDGDGIVDLYVAQGGSRGMPTQNPPNHDSLLFFGELDTNGHVIFRGGRSQAAKSGIHMRNGRGRFTYMFDVNGDGMIDIFASQSRRRDNQVRPGILLINQGDRTWKEDTSMMEYATTMILTDADGDGIANEVMISRGFCFPQRVGPGVDPEYPQFGEFSDEVKSFCSTRPVGTYAIYKFNPLTEQMEEISTPFYNVQPDNNLQPPCCPHGSFEGYNGCSAVSIASADFDNDHIADQVLLYHDKLIFYFSSDRPKGTLPIDEKYQGLVLDIPEYCTKGQSVRVVDLNNDGNLEILVMCKTPGAFAIYTQQGGDAKHWSRREDCGGSDSMGDINQRSLAYPTNLDEMFNDNVDCITFQYSHYKGVCDKFKRSGNESIRGAMGLSLVDLNNDGFTDAVYSNHFGYLRFFYNKPSISNANNKFITFKLKGDGINNNVYGIGSTLLLTIVHTDGRQMTTLREISFHQHISDKKGYQDDRITFGLGMDYNPQSLVVIWPNGNLQFRSLGQWRFTGSTNPLEILDDSILQSAIPSSLSIEPSTSPGATLPTSVSHTESSSPSLSPIDSNHICMDDTRFEFIHNNGKVKKCAWLGRGKTVKRLAIYCGDHDDVRAACAKSCEACNSSCKDDPEFTFTIVNGNKKDCFWLNRNEKNAKARKRRYCFEHDRSTPTPIAKFCTSSCGLCTD